MASPKKLPIIAFSATSWHGQWLGRQHKLSRLGKKGWPIIYSNGAKFSHDLKGLSLFGQVEKSDNVTLYHAGKILPRNYRFPLLDKWAIKHHCKALKKAMSIAEGDPFIVFCFNPSYLPYVKELDPEFVAYDLHDLFHLIGEKDALIHDELIARSDLVTAVSEVIWDEMVKDPSKERNVVINGVDIASFENNREPSELSKRIDSLPSPRIGYIGAINRKLDYFLLDRLAEKFTECQFVLVGYMNEASIKPDSELWAAFTSFMQRDNVVYVGPAQKEELPSCLEAFDIAIAPYITTNATWAFGASPLKIPEYLISGKPVIASLTEPILKSFKGYIDICDSYEEWEAAVDRNLQGNSCLTVQERQDYARTYDWEIVVDRIEGLILEMIKTSS